MKGSWFLLLVKQVNVVKLIIKQKLCKVEDKKKGMRESVRERRIWESDKKALNCELFMMMTMRRKGIR